MACRSETGSPMHSRKASQEDMDRDLAVALVRVLASRMHASSLAKTLPGLRGSS